jgi:hypothetical protein
LAQSRKGAVSQQPTVQTPEQFVLDVIEGETKIPLAKTGRLPQGINPVTTKLNANLIKEFGIANPIDFTRSMAERGLIEISGRVGPTGYRYVLIGMPGAFKSQPSTSVVGAAQKYIRRPATAEEAIANAKATIANIGKK